MPSPPLDLCPFLPSFHPSVLPSSLPCFCFAPKRKVFNLLDIDGSGEITIDEFVTAVKPDPGAGPEAEARTRKVLALLKQSAALAALANPDAYEESFRGMDTDNDGTITLVELATFCNTALPAAMGSSGGAAAKYKVLKRANGRAPVPCDTKAEYMKARRVEEETVRREEAQAAEQAKAPKAPKAGRTPPRRSNKKNKQGAAAGQGPSAEDLAAREKMQKFQADSAVRAKENKEKLDAAFSRRKPLGFSSASATVRAKEMRKKMAQRAKAAAFANTLDLDDDEDDGGGDDIY